MTALLVYVVDASVFAWPAIRPLERPCEGQEMPPSKLD